MSAGADTVDADSWRFRLASPVGSELTPEAGDRAAQRAFSRRLARFPVWSPALTRGHGQRRNGGANERPSVATSIGLRHPSERCAGGPRRQKLNDVLSVKQERCVVGSQLLKPPHLGNLGEITKCILPVDPTTLYDTV